MIAAANDIIPPDWPRWSTAKPSVVKPLTGGLTNQSFLIIAGNDRLVLRKNSAISEALDLNRSAEAAALRHAYKAGLCAPVIYCDPGHQYLVTRYIEGEPWCAGGADALKQLAQLVRSIHALPAIDTQLEIDDKVASYWRSIDDGADFYTALRALNPKLQRHIAIAKSLNDGVCLCHNDLLMANLIAVDNGNLYAIDWEYAAMGDPFYELAVIVEEYRLEKRQQQWLLAEYLNRPATQIDWQRLDHWRVIYGYLSVLWYAVQWCSGAMRQPHINDEIRDRASNLFALSSAILQLKKTKLF
ncbi:MULTISPECIES: choline kinase family protein [unclassified Microbulbifer]|uniref:choline kinase family protein n=1 Tax=unclassified Microbulbifer TaxID=2619833 RepID=UPI0027E5509C|nr:MULTISPECIES: choline kinase family protein [unclassified Microbulbifer]